MSGQARCSDEVKFDAEAQVTERGYPIKEVAARLGSSWAALIFSWSIRLRPGSKAKVSGCPMIHATLSGCCSEQSP